MSYTCSVIAHFAVIACLFPFAGKAAAQREDPAVDAALAPLVTVPPSTRIRDGMWKGTKKFGAVKFTGNPLQLLMDETRLEESEAAAKAKKASPDKKASAATVAVDTAPIAQIELPPPDPTPTSPKLKPETLPKGLSLPWKEQSAPAGETMDAGKRSGPDESMRRAPVKSRESLPAIPLTPRREMPESQGDVEVDFKALSFNALPDLIKLLKHKSPMVRARAADELGRRGDEAARAVPALIETLSDRSSRARASAALALGNIGGDAPKLRALLTPLLEDKNPDVSMSAKTALSRLP